MAMLLPAAVSPAVAPLPSRRPRCPAPRFPHSAQRRRSAINAANVGPKQPATTLPSNAPERVSSAVAGVPANSFKPAVYDLHKSFGLVMFSAYLLGTVSELAGLPVDLWMPVLTGAAIGGLFASLERFCVVRLWRAPARPQNVVVTGGSRGLGKALAREFLREGDRVFITSRSAAHIEQARKELQLELSADIEVYGCACDVSDPASVAAMMAAAREQLGTVDVFVNNAGYSGSFQSFLEATPEQIAQVVRTNMLGMLLCSREASKVMAEQVLGGHIFTMDGAGADGMPTPQYAAYGATKCGLVQLAGTLQAELEGSPVAVHTLSPGMMLTELLLEGATDANKQVFNILCEQPETVAAFLVPRVRSAVARGESGQYIRYLTTASALYRFLTAPARVGRFFDAEGRAVYPPEHERLMGTKARVTARLAGRASRRSNGLAVAYSASLAVSVLVLFADAGVWSL